nr:MAG TPA: hypothetical protein [Caudoviricetes sp.]
MDSGRKEGQNKVLKELSVEEIYNYYEQANIKEKEWIKQLVLNAKLFRILVEILGRSKLIKQYTF